MAACFCARTVKKSNGEVYEYWTLCETTRTELGPRQRVVATLGKLSEEDLAAGWEDIEALLEGRKPAPRQVPLEKGKDSSNASDHTQWELADLRNLSVERVREFGSVYLALALWRRLGLHELLSELMGEGREDVPWAEVAAVLTAGKFCGQASELGVAEEWYARTALEDISGIAPELINDDRLYRGLDHLGRHKDRLCEHLMQRYRDWFGVRFEFLLCDVPARILRARRLAIQRPRVVTAGTSDPIGERCQVCDFKGTAKSPQRKSMVCPQSYRCRSRTREYQGSPKVGLWLYATRSRTLQVGGAPRRDKEFQ